MKIKDFARIVKGDSVECAVTCNGSAYPFDPEDAFMLCAYGDFEVAGIDLSVFNDKSNPFIHVELELKAELVKEVLA